MGWRKIMEVGVLASGTANEGCLRKDTKAIYTNSAGFSLHTDSVCVYISTTAFQKVPEN